MAENTIANNTRTSTNNVHYRNLYLSFTTKDTEIDYFHIEPDILSLNEFDVTEENLNLQANEYLSLDRHFQSLDHTKEETIVLNVPVGYGKTTLCYELIRKYHAEGYYVIVCSPFQKLVEKDYAELRQYFNDAQIYNYKQLDFDTSTLNFEEPIALHARLHVMTINCLLQNPGDDHYEQAYSKRNFLFSLRKTIGNLDKKVVLFFDEIHESVPNFKNEFIPFLMKWSGLVHKCYVSSATYTCSSIPIIRYISFLTLGKIKIYYTPRIKTARQAHLHLHITTNLYSPKNLHPLLRINDLIDRYLATGSKINILSGYKAIVKALTNKKNEGDALVAKVLSLAPNICTAETEEEFNAATHNIGTNFKTGVNITDSNAVMIIILPVINKNSKKKHYGIFSDGIPSIVQSVARLRNGGNIHIFMYSPESILELENHISNIPIEIYQGKPSISYKEVNEGYQWMLNKYNKKKAFITNQIEFLNTLVEVLPELKYHYPTFQEELISKSQSLLVKKNVWMGKGLSPYVLWASINNQFCNSTLHSITYHTKHYRLINLTETNLFQEINHLLSNEKMTLLKNLTFRKGLIKLWEFIEKSEERSEDEESAIVYTNSFTYNGSPVTLTGLKDKPTFHTTLINILYQLHTEDSSEVQKEVYIRTCISNASAYSATNGEMPALIKTYRRLNEIRQEFIEFIQHEIISYKNEKLLHHNYWSELPDAFVNRVIEVVDALKEQDKLLEDGYSFLQDYKETKKQIGREFSKCFINLTARRRNYNGEIKQHYVVEEQEINNTILRSINFIE